MQDPAPTRRCGTEGITGHQGRGGGNGGGNRDGGWDGREGKYGDVNESRYGGENGGGNGRENGDENRYDGGGQEEPSTLRNGNGGGTEDARRWATPTCNQQLQPQDPMPQRAGRIMLKKTRAQERETRERIGEGGGEAKKRKKLHTRCRRDVGNGGDLGGNRKKRV